ncbi:MAG: lipoate--protein ligase [Clostridia bacterium]|nr:lipoate--protein ligase [Clostridia bacterium]
MIYIENTSVDPYYNMACDEYILKNMDFGEDILTLWRNDNAIIIGKNQNAFEEVNAAYVDEHGIKVCRRVTGGGAVYHDLNNLNFSLFIDLKDSSKLDDLNFFVLPVVKALSELGVNAEVKGRNDITIDGRKFSGLAQRIHKDKLLFHGTLMFDVDVTILSKCLNVKPGKLQSKGHKSVRSRVTNIKEYIKDDVDVLGFKEILKKQLFEGQEYKEYVLTDEDKANIQKIRDEKFATWEWNYGESPESNFKNAERFKGGEVDVRMMLEDGKIQKIRFYGDFLSTDDLDALIRALEEQRYDIETVDKILSSMDLRPFFGAITKDEIMHVMFP